MVYFVTLPPDFTLPLVYSLHFILSLHFTPGLQSAVRNLRFYTDLVKSFNPLEMVSVTVSPTVLN